jgi:hypothetical protein
MSDKVIKFRRSATATAQKAQKKEEEDKTSSFRDDVGAELARDMEKWEKEEQNKKLRRKMRNSSQPFRWECHLRVDLRRP